MYTDAMVAATRRQSGRNFSYDGTKIKARCEHGNIHHLHQEEQTGQQAIEKKLLTGSPLNQMHRQQLELTDDLLLQGHWGKEDAVGPAHKV